MKPGERQRQIIKKLQSEDKLCIPVAPFNRQMQHLMDCACAELRKEGHKIKRFTMTADVRQKIHRWFEKKSFYEVEPANRIAKGPAKRNTLKGIDIIAAKHVEDFTQFASPRYHT